MNDIRCNRDHAPQILRSFFIDDAVMEIGSRRKIDFRLGDVQEEFPDEGAVAREVKLVRVDVLEAFAPEMPAG